MGGQNHCTDVTHPTVNFLFGASITYLRLYHDDVASKASDGCYYAVYQGGQECKDTSNGGSGIRMGRLRGPRASSLSALAASTVAKAGASRSASVGGGGYGDADVAKLMDAIQMLCQSTHPLGQSIESTLIVPMIGVTRTGTLSAKGARVVRGAYSMFAFDS